ncbi:CCCH RNA binding domain-containing protein [Cryptosporidium ubiquitum]|uniref:CCCH RNA binding domain-containing protein n=1 Tax=Cryptosporidium ubiquitum TaxID=857276 RepID=A0A1J4MM32_9CRYT|nr:CCCH RNA binding domain-containing protein [Cryptosporidium ubiquitum]OII75305.1 CCCH RNA binding domain-containing protein [Cryptosporidium ubiquitum]
MANALLSIEELTRFRTKLCRRSLKDGCDFGPLRCQYSHNVYWPRRCPFYLSDRSALRYLPDICPDITILDQETGKVANFCNRGGYCPYSHSIEEVIYHPLIYKSELCVAFQKGECKTYYCHLIHGLAERRQEKSYTLPFTRGINLNKYPNVTLVDKTSSENENVTNSSLFSKNKNTEIMSLDVTESKDRNTEIIQIKNLECFHDSENTKNFSIQPQLKNKFSVRNDFQTNKLNLCWQELINLSCFSNNFDIEPGTELKHLLNKWRKVAECPELYINQVNLVRLEYWQYISTCIHEISSIINELGKFYCNKAINHRENLHNLDKHHIDNTELKECIDFSSVFTEMNSDLF